MGSINRKNRDYITIAVTIAVSINAFITYLLTMAPDVPFWDCGEFIACSNTLGVAHPPGTPLFILIGRIFILFNFFFQNLAERVNFISVLTSSAAVGFSCIIIIKILKIWFKNRFSEFPYNLFIYAGGIIGALYMTYSSTYWFSADEAEVYGSAMFLMQLIVFLSLKWYENKDKPHNNRYLLIIVYIAFLSIAIHMTVFLVMPAVFLFIIYSDKKLLRDWRIWMLGIALLSMSISYVWFLIATSITIIISLLLKSGNQTIRSRSVWGLVLGASLLSILAFSVHLYIPIRSLDNPFIDMNDPDNLSRFSYYMERKQYGDESMIAGMFHRKGSWENQFGNFHRMGFWYFFKEQYSSAGMVWLPLLIGLIGIVTALRKSPKAGGLLVLLLLICTIGLVLYMNFSDGLHGERLEVRDRDYFFTPGFMYFAMFIGFGTSALGAFIYEKLLRNKLSGGIVGIIPAVIMLILSLFQTAPAHWNSHDRTGNYVARDYAFNLLNSCKPNAILFTNGDNDTYPLWYLQLVQGVRTDVHIMNLSLMNTDWYLIQNKNQYGIPIPLNDDQIRWHYHKDAQGNLLMTPEKPFRDPITGKQKYLTPNLMNVKAEMVRMITIANNFKRPIFLAATAGSDVQDLAHKYLYRKGMAYEITPEEHNAEYDIASTDSLLENVFKFTNLDNPNVNNSGTELAMSISYPEMYISIAEKQLADGDTTDAIDHLLAAQKKFPFYFRTSIRLNSLYKAMGKPEEGIKFLQESADNISMMEKRYPEEILWPLFLGGLYLELNDIQESIRAYERCLEIDPDERMAFDRVLIAYQKAGEMEKASKLVARWQRKYPNDTQIEQIARYFKSRQ